jgi:lysozyme family protein
MNIFDFFRKLFTRKSKIQPQIVEQSSSEISDRDKFEKAMKFVRVVEGGKFNHPNDPGGFTNMGLTQRDYPNLDLKNLTRKQADDIFYKDYWRKSSASKLPDPVYVSYFDSVVNTGLGRANKILQQALNVKQDGKIGPITLKAINDYKDPVKLAIAVADSRQSFYERLTKNRPQFKSFIRGWTRRTKALKEYIKTGSFSW